MWIESAGIFAAFFVLALIGWGPSLLILNPGENRVAFSLALAPAMGYVILLILGLPLVRYIAPVQSWGLALTLVLVVASLVIVVRDARTDRGEYTRTAKSHGVWLGSGATLLCLALLASPLAINGIQYAVFRGNSSDAFFYMTASETMRITPWQTLMGGVDLSDNNLQGLSALANASPVALWWARGMVHPHVLAKVIEQAWLSVLLSIPVERFFYASQLLSVALAFPLALMFGKVLKAHRGIILLAAGAVVLGFWMRVPIERDAGYEVGLVPLLLFVVLAWIQLEQEPPRLISRARVWMAIGIAAILAYYLPPAPALIVGAIVYYALGILQRKVEWRSIIYHALTLALALGVLVVTGQIDLLARYWWATTIYVDNAGAQYSSRATEFLQRENFRAFWGLPRSLLLGDSSQISTFILRRLIDLLTLAMSAALIVTPFIALKRNAPVAARLTVSVLIGGLVTALIFVAMGNAYSGGRIFNYMFPFVIFSIVTFVTEVGQYLPSSVSRFVLPMATTVVVLWLLSQVAMSVYIPFTSRVQIESRKTLSQDYELATFTNYLNTHQPKLLAVATPKDKGWVYPLYITFVISEFPTHFLSGIIIDNKTSTPARWFDELELAPDYLLANSGLDLMELRSFAKPVVTTHDLTLYQMTPAPLDAWEQLEGYLQKVDSKLQK